MRFDPYRPRPIDRATAVPLDPDADLSVLDEAKIFAAPDNPADWPAWRSTLTRWREQARAGYDGSAYDQAAWVADCHVIGLVWLWDERLYDHERRTFTVDEFVAAMTRDYGGFDGVVLWHAYPVIGLDDRNQFDFYRDVPGLGQVVRALQARGLRVFVDYNPWDVGTRRESVSDAEAVAALVADLGVDGVFLDTLREGAADLRKMLGEQVVLESESRVPLARITDHAMSWAQWFDDSEVPGVLRAKWFERRHMLHHTRRWHRDHLDELHSAWLNGAGMLIWDTVFGVWVGWNERDRSLLRAMRAVWQSYGDVFTTEAWTPLADHPGQDIPVYASRWQQGDQTIWTVVNRSPQRYEGVLLRTDLPLRSVTDLTGGTVIDWAATGEISGCLEGGGIACIYSGPDPAPAASHAGFSADTTFPVRMPVRLPYQAAPSPTVPSGMVAVAGGRHQLTVTYRLRETGLYGEAPFVAEWKPLPPRLHAPAAMVRDVTLRGYAIDVREVSEAEYAAFASATARTYRPTGDPDAPATGVDLADARAYASWRGARLPTEDEWQVAALAGHLERRAPLVWNWTESEQTDGVTRFAILKGGSDYRAEGSDWYFDATPSDGTPLPTTASAKLLLLGDGLMRSRWVGFRCAVDREAS